MSNAQYETPTEETTGKLLIISLKKECRMDSTGSG
jgi:hypothetical protein